MLITFVGNIMRNRFPQLYKMITRFTFNLKKKNYLFISDSFGESFKNYISENAMAEKLNDLKSNLDEYSQKTIDVVYQRILNYPEFRYKQILIPKRDNIVGGLLNEEKIRFNPKKIKKEQNISLRTSLIESSVFQFYHGLKYLPKNILNSIEGKDFIDLGAFVGDTAIALRKYNYKKIYSIEMSRQSIVEYKKNMKLNLIDDDKYKIINCAIVKEDGLPPIKIIDSGSAGLSLKRDTFAKAKEIEIEQKTLHLVINEYNIKPSFIKMDLEGMAMECLLGGLDPIKNFRPVLSIAIYHNPVELFEIKPFLESELSNYSFIIRKLSNRIDNNNCHSEIILLAFPNEKA